MRFLVVTYSSSAPPMEMVPPLIQAMQGWLDRHADKMDEVWGFAGIQGGGGILNVESADELDAIMQEFPFAPFSQIQIHALVDLQKQLERSLQVVQSMVPPGR